MPGLREGDTPQVNQQDFMIRTSTVDAFTPMVYGCAPRHFRQPHLTPAYKSFIVPLGVTLLPMVWRKKTTGSPQNNLPPLAGKFTNLGGEFLTANL